MSSSKCTFSLRQFFVKFGLLSSKCFISKVGCFLRDGSYPRLGWSIPIRLETNLSLKFTNGTVQKICLSILASVDFRSGLCLCCSGPRKCTLKSVSTLHDGCVTGQCVRDRTSCCRSPRLLSQRLWHLADGLLLRASQGGLQVDLQGPAARGIPRMLRDLFQGIDTEAITSVEHDGAE